MGVMAGRSTRSLAIMKIIAAFFLLVMGVLAGCSTNAIYNVPDTHQFQRAAPPPSGQALVYIFRPFHPDRSSDTPVVMLNERSVIGLRNHSYTWIYALPGRYRVSTRDSSAFSPEVALPIDFELKAGETYYLRLLTLAQPLDDTSKRASAVLGGAIGAAVAESTYLNRRISWAIFQDRGEAEKHILGTHYIQPNVVAIDGPR